MFRWGVISHAVLPISTVFFSFFLKNVFLGLPRAVAPDLIGDAVSEANWCAVFSLLF